MKGEAEAYAVEIKAKAEAEQMIKKAEAFNQYKEAAMLDMMMKVMPQVAAEVSGPISQVMFLVNTELCPCHISIILQ